VALARVYTVDPNVPAGINIGTGGVLNQESVLMYGATSGEFNISAVRVGTVSGGSAVYPSNGTITWRNGRHSGARAGTVLRRDAKLISSARSASLTSNAARYRPPIPDPPKNQRVGQDRVSFESPELQTQDTSVLVQKFV